MALDRKNIDFLAVNTLPSFASWEILNGGASVLVDTATLPPQSSVGHSLNREYNNGLDSSEYRKFTLTLSSKPSIDSNYTSFQQVNVNLHIVYAANTNSQINETDIEIVMNEDDIVENTNDTYTLQRIITTNSRAIQSLVITISNQGLNTITVSDARLHRSADINTSEMLNQISQIKTEMTPRSFNIYEPNLDNIINGIGVVVESGVEYKYKPIRVGNRTSSVETNFCESMPVVYIPKEIDLSTSDPGNADEGETDG